ILSIILYDISELYQLSLVNSMKLLPLCRGDLNERFHSLVTHSVWDQRTQSLVLQSSSCNSTCRDPVSQSHRSCGSQPEWPGTCCKWTHLSGLILIHASRSLQMAINLAWLLWGDRSSTQLRALVESEKICIVSIPGLIAA